MKISAHNLLALAHLAMVMVLVHLAMVVAGTDTVSSSSSASKSVTTSGSSKDTTKNTSKNTTTTEEKRGLCCNPSCRECTRVPCNDYTECRIFGFRTCCRSPPVTSTDFSKNVMWGFIEDRDCYVLRKRVLHQI